jgi:hypothetical protein
MAACSFDRLAGFSHFAGEKPAKFTETAAGMQSLLTKTMSDK